MTKETVNVRERKERERRLNELGLRPVDNRPVCIICQNPMPLHCGPVCGACD